MKIIDFPSAQKMQRGKISANHKCIHRGKALSVRGKVGKQPPKFSCRTEQVREAGDPHQRSDMSGKS